MGTPLLEMNLWRIGNQPIEAYQPYWLLKGSFLIRFDGLKHMRCAGEIGIEKPRQADLSGLDFVHKKTEGLFKAHFGIFL
ncbi:hypothetical protein ACSMDK_22430 [Yersinia enterocolitica]|uniref:hypothetical protein n=1 Tax=Yersinia TaxID=629 RepID=UPI00330D0F7E|nr:hypothetical protein [Yersinia enterocolitica]